MVRLSVCPCVRGGEHAGWAGFLLHSLQCEKMSPNGVCEIEKLGLVGRKMREILFRAVEFHFRSHESRWTLWNAAYTVCNRAKRMEFFG